MLPAVLLLAGLAATPPSLVVLPFTHAEEVAATTADVAQSLVTAELARDRTLTVVSSADVTRMLDLAADRAQLGCVSVDDACATDIAAALGATHLVTGALAREDDVLTLSLALVDAESAAAISRERLIGRTLLELSERLHVVVERLLGRAFEKPVPALPPLVVERRMSDPSAVQGALVVGAVSAAAAAVVVLPFTSLAVAIAAGALSPVFVLAIGLPFAFAPLLPIIGAAVASLTTDVVDGRSMGLLRAALAAGASLALGNMLYNLFVGPITTLDESNEAWRVTVGVAAALTPIVVVAAALGGTAGAAAGVALFDEDALLDDGAPSEGP